MSHLRDVVLPHVGDALAILVASREPCIALASSEKLAASGRKFKLTDAEGLAAVKLPKSWIVAVLLCPGDDTTRAATWAAKHPDAVRRTLFYLHPDTDARRALAAWHDAGFAVPSSWTVRRWEELHPHLGSHWNNLIHEDFCKAKLCPLR